MQTIYSGAVADTPRFQLAVIYGKTVNADPTIKANYEAVARLGRSAYNVILPDIFNAPDF